METWYQVQFDKIRKVEVISATKHFVTLPGGWKGKPNRDKKITSWRSYFQTWKEAHNHVLKQAQEALTAAKEGIKSAQAEVIEAEDHLYDVKAMKEPS